MICPHCTQSVTYKERNYNICSKCNKEFAFDPKTHTLQLSDTYFSNVVKKLSNNDKLFFTPQQLQFALSQKKIKNSFSVYWLFIPAIITTIIAIVVSANFVFKDSINSLFAGGIIFSLWMIFIPLLRIYRKKNFSLPQSLVEFESNVLHRWKQIYGKYPDKLLVNYAAPGDFNSDLKGILICDNGEIGMCLRANHAARSLAIAADLNQLNDLLQKRGVQPIYVLHDASRDGYRFFEKLKQQFGPQTQVFDIGFRPQGVMKTNLMKFREPGTSHNFNSLTADENKWLNDGYYTPLFALRPEKLIQYVTKQLEHRSQALADNNAREKAQAIGFMTWVGEK